METLMSERRRHSKKEIEQAIQFAEHHGWQIEITSSSTSHVWGRLKCPLRTREGCSMSVNSTPRNTTNHANAIKRKIARCPHCKMESKNDC